MTHRLRLFLALALALAAQPALAHGSEKHDDAAAHSGAAQAARAAQTTAPAEGSPVERARAAAPDQPRADHDRAPASVWTMLHPATVHFPIALLLMAAMIELVSILRPAPGLSDAVRVMVWGGAAGAVVAAFFGWIHTGIWLGGGPTMQWHRWMGTALAFAAPMAALLSVRADRTAFRVALFLIAAVLLGQGYLGGELAHGPRHLGF